MPQLAEVPLDSERTQALSPPHVLVIDDDMAVQRLMVTLLSRRGAIVECVADGEEALTRLADQDFDAIILDLMLPRKNGFDVIDALKQRSPEVLQRVIVVTAASEHSLQMLDRGAVRSMLRKPFDIDDFIREIFACASRAPVMHEH